MRRGTRRGRQAAIDAAFARVQRDDALREQRFRCKYCRKLLSYQTATRDHVEPRAVGGSDQKSNIAAACERCNSAKGKLPLKEFLRLIESPKPGEPLIFLLIWSDLRINSALDRMEKNLFRAVGKKT